MLQTMLYLANQQSNYSLQELYNLPPGVTPAGKGFWIEKDEWMSERMSHLFMPFKPLILVIIRINCNSPVSVELIEGFNF